MMAESIFKPLQDSWRVSGNVDVTAGAPGVRNVETVTDLGAREGFFNGRTHLVGFEISRLVQKSMFLKIE